MEQTAPLSGRPRKHAPDDAVPQISIPEKSEIEKQAGRRRSARSDAKSRLEVSSRKSQPVRAASKTEHRQTSQAETSPLRERERES